MQHIDLANYQYMNFWPRKKSNYELMLSYFREPMSGIKEIQGSSAEDTGWVYKYYWTVILAKNTISSSHITFHICLIKSEKN